MNNCKEYPSNIPPNQRTSWLERNPKKSIIFIVGFFFILLDLILASFFRTPNIINTYYHHDLVANYHGVLAWGAKKYIIHTNSLGFKDQVNRVVKLKNDKYRIVFIGDSFTEGVGFPYDETFIGLIDKKLDQSTYEVLNAGVSSYSPKLYFLKIKYLIENVGLKFNELCVFIDISDIQDEREYEHFRPFESYLMDILNRFNFLLKRYSFIGHVTIREFGNFKHELLIKNISFKSPKKNNDERNTDVSEKDYLWKNRDEFMAERGAWTYDERVFNKWGEDGFALATDNMDKLYKLCKDNNIKLTIAVYPWPNEIINNNLNSNNVSLWMAFCKKRGIPFINCYPYFFTLDRPDSIIEDYYIRNDVHFNLDGQKLMARAWFDHFNALNRAGN